MTIVLPWWWWIAALVIYFAGAAITFFVNMIDMVYVTRPWAIVRNTIFWPFFIWPLILSAGR